MEKKSTWNCSTILFSLSSSSSRLFVLRSSSLLKTLKIRSSTQSLKIRSSTSVLLQPDHLPSTRSSSSALRISNQIVFFGVAFFFRFVLLQVRRKSSFEDSVLLLKLESYRLKIYVAKLLHNSSRTRV